MLVTARAQHLLGQALDDVVQGALGLHVSLADRTPEQRAGMSDENANLPSLFASIVIFLDFMAFQFLAHDAQP